MKGLETNFIFRRNIKCVSESLNELEAEMKSFLDSYPFNEQPSAYRLTHIALQSFLSYSDDMWRAVLSMTWLPEGPNPWFAFRSVMRPEEIRLDNNEFFKVERIGPTNGISYIQNHNGEFQIAVEEMTKGLEGVISNLGFIFYSVNAELFLKNYQCISFNKTDDPLVFDGSFVINNEIVKLSVNHRVIFDDYEYLMSFCKPNQ